MSHLEIPEFPDMECLLRETCRATNHTMLLGGDTPPLGLAELKFLPMQRIVSGFTGHLVFWPEGKPDNAVAVISSRLGRNLESRGAWFRALRATCARLAEQDLPVINMPGSTVARFLPRATELFATPRIDCSLAQPPHKTRNAKRSKNPRETGNVMAQWWSNLATVKPLSTENKHRLFRAFLSPIVMLVELEDAPARLLNVDISGNLSSNLPATDLINARLASEFYALHVRNGGNIERALTEQLENTDSKVHLAIGEHLNSAKAQDSLLESGAIGWYLYQAATGSRPPNTHESSSVNVSSQNTDDDPSHSHRAPMKPSQPRPSHAKPNLRISEDFLTHCTRRITGPWPDQSEKAYLDDLILSRDGADHSPFAALQRIVVGRKLVASRLGIRGGTAVVSFTSVRLEELKALRVFRSHRGRWDFEPYGISIRRSALKILAKPLDNTAQPSLRAVQYASNEAWDQLDKLERPFFQKSQTTTKAGNVIDWSAEEEWRFIGDVDLSQIEANDAVVFVKTKTEATNLQSVSPWPVIALLSRD